jgi:site-specific DNA recombinase
VKQSSPSPTPLGIRAAIYVRVSTAKQEDDGTSLDTQEACSRALCAERGLPVDEALVLRETHTGVELWERPKLTKLREAIRAKAISHVVCYAIDRLARDPVHLGVVLSEADHAGVEIVFVSEPLDDSPEGQLIRFVRGYAAKVEHEKIKERAVRGRRARAESGKLLPGSRPPYGYVWVDEIDPKSGKTVRARLAENPVTAAVVRRIFADILAGISARRLAMNLTAEGIPTPTGRARWSVPTIGGIVRHPVYYGEPRAFRYGRTKQKGGKDIRYENPEDKQMIFRGAAPALVTKEMALAAAARLSRNKSESPRNNSNPEAALLRAGIAKCAYCGHPLVATNTTEKGPIYRCNPSNRDRHGCRHFGIQAKVLDAAVWSRVEARLKNPAIMIGEIEKLRRDDPKSANTHAVERGLAEIERRQRNLVARLAGIDDDAIASLVQAELASLGQQARQLMGEREALARLHQEWEVTQKRLSDLDAWCRDIAANIDDMTYDQKRLALHAFEVKVRVWSRADRNPPWEITGNPFIHTTSSSSSNRSPT